MPRSPTLGSPRNVAVPAGLNVQNRHVEWGAGLPDLDNDGRADVLYVTGHVYPEVERVLPHYPHRGPRVVFRNLGKDALTAGAQALLSLTLLVYHSTGSLHAVGVTLSNFAPGGAEQGALFDEAEAGRRSALFRAFDGVRSAYGHGVVVSGRALRLQGRLEEDRHGFVLRTPSLTK